MTIGFLFLTMTFFSNWNRVYTWLQLLEDPEQNLTWSASHPLLIGVSEKCSNTHEHDWELKTVQEDPRTGRQGLSSANPGTAHTHNPCSKGEPDLASTHQRWLQMFKKNKPFMTKQDLSVKPRELPILQEKKIKLCIFALITLTLFVKIVMVTVTAPQNCLPSWQAQQRQEMT